MSKERNSSIELAKCIAIVMIVLSHSVPRYGYPDAIGSVDFSIARLGGG